MKNLDGRTLVRKNLQKFTQIKPLRVFPGKIKIQNTKNEKEENLVLGAL